MLGLRKSLLDGTEAIYSSSGSDSIKVDSYSYREFMSDVKDQGNTMQCAAYSVAQVVEWHHRTMGVRRPKFDILDLYGRRSEAEGMSFKEVVSLLKDRYTLNGESHRIVEGVMVTSEFLFRSFLLSAPLVLGLPVRDNRATTERFWRGDGSYGLHAVTCTGFNSEGLEILNSWGSAYGDGGYGLLPWSDLNQVTEAWGFLFD